jgi:hypothetical protein
MALHDTLGPVFLVLDGHPVHRSKAVKAFAASTGGRLRYTRCNGSHISFRDPNLRYITA